MRDIELVVQHASATRLLAPDRGVDPGLSARGCHALRIQLPGDRPRIAPGLLPAANSRATVEKAGMPFKILDEHVETTSGHVSISTMHLAKGLELRAVAVMDCDDEVIPLQERIETLGDDANLHGGL